MKKKTTITIIILLVVVLFFFTFFFRPTVSYDKQLFIKNKSSYDKVATFCYDCYQNSQSSIDILVFSITNDNSLYCYDNREYYSLTDEQKNSLRIVEETFSLDHHTLESLYVTDNYVIFNIVNGRATFIYSVDNSKPTFVNTPKEDSQYIYVEKIVEHWYFACNQD